MARVRAERGCASLCGTPFRGGARETKRARRRTSRVQTKSKHKKKSPRPLEPPRPASGARAFALRAAHAPLAPLAPLACARPRSRARRFSRTPRSSARASSSPPPPPPPPRPLSTRTAGRRTFKDELKVANPEYLATLAAKRRARLARDIPAIDRARLAELMAENCVVRVVRSCRYTHPSPPSRTFNRLGR